MRKDPSHERALFNACRKGQLAKVKQLLADGADPVHATSAAPPLVASVFGGNAEVTQALLDADPQVADHHAQAVAYAALWDSDSKKAVFDLLVARGALTGRTSGRSSGIPKGVTPLALALSGFEAALVMYQGAKARKELEQVERQVQRLLEAGADPETPSLGKRAVQQVRSAAALHDERKVAAEMSERIVALLVKHGAKP